MSKDSNEFQWTNELRKEFIERYMHTKTSFFGHLIDEFKASKAPSPVIEKNNEWEIISCYNEDHHDVHDFISNQDPKGGIPCWEMGCKIWSVRRVSDSVAFTVGDSVEFEGVKFKISEFIVKESIYMLVRFDTGLVGYFNHISHAPIPQVKKPIVETSMISYIDEFPMKVIVVVNGIEKEYRPK